MVHSLARPAVDAKCPAAGTLTATVTTSCPPPGDSDSATSDIEVPCDLCIVKSVDKDTADPGDPLLYTIEVTNPGCVAVPSATVSDIFPSELEGVMWCEGAACTPDETPDLFDTLDLPPDGSSKKIYRASGTIPPLFAGTICNTAEVEFAGDEADPTDNNSSTVCTVVGPPGEVPIPTASDYALIALALLLATFALARLRHAARRVPAHGEQSAGPGESTPGATEDRREREIDLHAWEIHLGVPEIDLHAWKAHCRTPKIDLRLSEIHLRGVEMNGRAREIFVRTLAEARLFSTGSRRASHKYGKTGL